MAAPSSFVLFCFSYSYRAARYILYPLRRRSNRGCFSRSGIGSILYPPGAFQRQPSISFGLVTRLIAYIPFATPAMCLTNLRIRLPYHLVQSGAMVNNDALEGFPFLFFGLGVPFAITDIYVAYFYKRLRAIEMSL